MNTNEKKLRSVLIYVPPGEFQGTTNQLNEFITQNKFTETWWNFIPSVYVVNTNHELADVKRAIHSFLGNTASFLVIEVDPVKVTGFLKPGGWQAFKKDIQNLNPDEDAKK
jgi:hypothetical protein